MRTPRVSRAVRTACAAAGAIAGVVTAGASSLGAQEALLPTAGWGLGSSISAWHFAKPIPQSGGALANIVEVAFPFRVRAAFGRWSFDLSGAGAVGAVHLTANAATRGDTASGDGGDGGGDRLVSIVGPTDVKLRLTGPLYGDKLLLTLGLNLPTGKVGLNADETSALQAVGAPALRMPIGAFGTGAGATIGVIRAFEGDDWAIALGGSLEQRTEYSPIALALASGKAETRVAPGTAAHVTIGVDRPLGENRWSLLLVGDVFTKDKVTLAGADSSAANNDYKLGPQMTATTRIDIAASRWRESAFNIGARLRSAFSDSAGVKVSGSSGTYFEGSIGGVRGGTEGTGLVVGLDGRWHSGLGFTDAMVGAAVTAVGVTLGFERLGTRSATRFIVHGQYGTFDTGTANTSGFGVTLGLSVGARREAR